MTPFSLSLHRAAPFGCGALPPSFSDVVYTPKPYRLSGRVRGVSVSSTRSPSKRHAQTNIDAYTPLRVSNRRCLESCAHTGGTGEYLRDASLRPDGVCPSFSRNSRGHLRISDSLASYAVHERCQPLKAMPLDVALVQAKGKLVNVPAKMFLAGVMVDAMQPALQDGPDALNGIGGHRPTGILASRMVDGIVPVEQAVEVTEANVIVRVKLAARFNAPMNLAMYGVKRSVFDDLDMGASAALPHSEYGNLADGPAPSVELLSLVLVGLNTAHKALVDLDGAAKLVNLIVTAAGFPETAEHKPRGLLGNANLFGKLHRRDPLAGRHQQVHGIDPLVQGDVTSLEDGSSPHGKVEVDGQPSLRI
jgi:hypothetical protein